MDEKIYEEAEQLKRRLARRSAKEAQVLAANGNWICGRCGTRHSKCTCRDKKGRSQTELAAAWLDEHPGYTAHKGYRPAWRKNV